MLGARREKAMVKDLEKVPRRSRMSDAVECGMDEIERALVGELQYRFSRCC